MCKIPENPALWIRVTASSAAALSCDIWKSINLKQRKSTCFPTSKDRGRFLWASEQSGGLICNLFEFVETYGNSHSVLDPLGWVDLIQYPQSLWWPIHCILRQVHNALLTLLTKHWTLLDVLIMDFTLWGSNIEFLKMRSNTISCRRRRSPAFAWGFGRLRDVGWRKNLL